MAKITAQGVRDRPGIAASLFEPLAEVGISVDVIVQNAGADGSTDLTFTVKREDLSRAERVARRVVKELGGGGVIASLGLAKVSVVGTGMRDAPGYASDMFRALADAGINIEMITTSEIRITCIVSEERIGEAARALHSAFDLDAP